MPRVSQEKCKTLLEAIPEDGATGQQMEKILLARNIPMTTHTAGVILLALLRQGYVERKSRDRYWIYWRIKDWPEPEQKPDSKRTYKVHPAEGAPITLPAPAWMENRA